MDKEFYRSAFRSISDGVIAADALERLIMLNPAAEKLLALNAEEVVGRPLSEWLVLTDAAGRAPLESPIQRTLRTGESFVCDDLSSFLSGPNVSPFPVEYSVAAIDSEQGERVGVLLTFHDVSAEYRRKEESLAERANNAAAIAMAQIYDFRVDTKTLKIKGGTQVANVWPIEGQHAAPAEVWLYSEDIPVWRKNFDAVKNGQKQQATFQYRVLQNGSMRYFRTFLRAGLPGSDEITGVLQEITDFVRDQKKQTALDVLWTACLNTVPAMVFVKSVNDGGRYRQCNAQFAEFVGLSPEAVVGRTDEEMFRAPRVVQQFHQNDLKVVESGRVQEFNELAVDKQGAEHQFRAIRLPIRDADGHLLLFGIAIDVTEDYRLRTQLQDHATNWEIASQIARIVTYRLNPKTREIRGDALLAEFWPVENGRAAAIEEWIHPDDVELFNTGFRDVLSGRLPRAVFVYRVVKPDGLRYYRNFVQMAGDASGEMNGMVQDVTPFLTAQQQKDAVLLMWQKIVDSIPAMIYMKDADNDYRYLQCNRNTARFYGRRLDDLIDRRAQDLMENEEDAERIVASDRSVMAAGVPQTLFEQVRDSAGILHRYETTKIPAKNEDGRPVLICMTQETTELFELSEIRKVISSAFEQLFTIEDPQKGISLILKNLCEHIGFSRAFIASIDDHNKTVELYTSYIPDGERPLFDSPVLSLSGSHEFPWFRFMLHSRAGEVYHFDFTDGEDLKRAKHRFPGIWEKKDAFDIRGLRVNYVYVNGKPWGCICFVAQHQPMKVLSMNEVRLLEMAVHIIELAISREQTVAKLEQALEEARAADNAKSFFLASMSHEIRTPLNAVLGFADLLNSVTLDPATQREYIANISLAGHSLLQLINDILDLSKLEAGQVVFMPERTNLTDFCREIASLFSHSANEKNLKLLFDTENLPVVYIDQQRLRQILFNLVGNAIKFTFLGGITVSMELKKTAPGEGDLIVCVKDTGIGIAQADCERLFEPFVQLTRMRGTNATNNGTGLGLPIVKKMITQMGGVISVTSKPERGSCFRFMIPSVRCDELESANDAADRPKILGLCPPNEEPRVLLVDDLAINLKVLSAMLRRLHIHYETALSGAEALQTLAKGNFNIVLIDLYMPQMSGEELAHIIRSEPKYASIRLAVVTAEKDRSSYDAALFDAVMEKPISRDKLYESIYGS